MTQMLSDQWRAPFLCVVVIGLLVSRQAKKPKGLEPPLEIEISVDDAKRTVFLDEEFEVEIDDRPVKMKLSAMPWRTFRLPGFEFRYPASHGFEVHESAPGTKLWSLDGRSNVLMVGTFEGRQLRDCRDTLVGDLVNQFKGTIGRESIMQSTTEVMLGGKRVEAAHIKVSLFGTNVTFEVFGTQVVSGVVVFTIKDSVGAGWIPSEETLLVKEMLDDSFVGR